MSNVIHKKPHTYGIDRYILRVQNEFATKLKWNGTVDIYGKVQPIDKDGQLVPACYDILKDYVADIFANDTVTATIGFVVKNRVIDVNFVRNTIDVVVSVDLNQAFQNQLRDDEKAMQQVLQILQQSPFLTDRTAIKEGNRDVWSGFNFAPVTYNDMQPFYVFSVTVQMDYESDYADCDKLI